MLTHPIDEEAARFYTQFGFIASPLCANSNFFAALKDARRRSSANDDHRLPTFTSQPAMTSQNPASSPTSTRCPASWCNKWSRNGRCRRPGAVHGRYRLVGQVRRQPRMSGRGGLNAVQRIASNPPPLPCATQSVGGGFLEPQQAHALGGCCPARMLWMMAGSSSVRRSSSLTVEW